MYFNLLFQFCAQGKSGDQGEKGVAGKPGQKVCCN